MACPLFDRLPLELRIQIFDEVVSSQLREPLQSQITDHNFRKRYHVFAPFYNLLRVNKQMRHEINSVCLPKIDGLHREYLYAKWNVVNKSKRPYASRTMDFDVSVATDAEYAQFSSRSIGRIHLGIFFITPWGRFHHRTDVCWNGLIDREARKILLEPLKALSQPDHISDHDYQALIQRSHANHGFRSFSWGVGWASRENSKRIAEFFGWDHPY